jgi:23S rRNA (cytidine1920-2'-O)/16S rRNA (cytidine1409-2'-O)-methyltransferase
MKQRLDNGLVKRGLVTSRSQAESYIKLGKVSVNGRVITKSGFSVEETAKIELAQGEQYVSRAGLKLASVTKTLGLDFKDKIILDVGSSTGGFTDYALKHGAKKVIAVDVGTDQLHASLHDNPKIELHEKTDICDFKTKEKLDLVLVDVSFISLKQVLPAISKLLSPNSKVVAMLKPQFEVGDMYKHKGVIKNNTVRREILKDFEAWAKQYFVVQNKADSEVAGAKGNQERFYLLKSLQFTVNS